MSTLLVVGRLSILAICTSLFACGGADPGTDASSTTDSDEQRLSTASGTALGSAKGGWTNDAVAFTSFDDATGAFTAEGSSTWSGDLPGPTTWTAAGVFDLATGDISGTVDETYTGAGGTLHFTETLFVAGATGDTDIRATVDGGTGVFAGTKGSIRFGGFTQADGLGVGTYKGHLSR